MTPPQTGERRPGLWLEHCFIPAIFAGIAYSLWFLYEHGYFPQPFFYEPSGTWMDWFAMGYWARVTGTYDVLGAIYPPLSFLVLRVLGKDSCYLGEGEPSRDCDWVGIVAIHGIYVIAIILTAWMFYRLDRRTALPRSIALSAGLPMLFTLERGNILILTYICLLLAVGPLLRSARLRWLCAGLAVNFKVYLIGAILAPLLRRRWLAVEGTLVCIIGVYLVTWLLFGQGSPIEIITALTSYTAGFEAASPLDLWFAISYLPLISILKGTAFQISAFLGSRTIEIGLLVLPLYVNFVRGMILLAVAASWLRPEVVPPHRLVLFGLLIAISSSEVGGYTQILVFLLVFMERWRGFARPAAILIAYILCVPFEIVLAPLPPVVRDSYMVGHEVVVQFGVGLMSLLRPGLVEMIGVLLACATMRDVYADYRAQGWSARWRFRNDVPLTPSERPPSPPGAAA